MMSLRVNESARLHGRGLQRGLLRPVESVMDCGHAIYRFCVAPDRPKFNPSIGALMPVAVAQSCQLQAIIGIAAGRRRKPRGASPRAWAHFRVEAQRGAI